MNALLLHGHKKVAYLDTDVGQTQFTPPGILSLTVIDKINLDLMIPCLKTPERCLFFGDISPEKDPDAYLAYSYFLYDHYMKKYNFNDAAGNHGSRRMPLVINTRWVKGIGNNILVNMLRYMSPTHVVKIGMSNECKNLPAGAFWLNGGNADTGTVIEIKTALQDNLNSSVLVQKEARLRYFNQCFPSKTPISTFKELEDKLAVHSPYEISTLSVKIRHLHCQVLNYSDTSLSVQDILIGAGTTILVLRLGNEVLIGADSQASLTMEHKRDPARMTFDMVQSEVAQKCVPICMGVYATLCGNSSRNNRMLQHVRERMLECTVTSGGTVLWDVGVAASSFFHEVEPVEALSHRKCIVYLFAISRDRRRIEILEVGDKYLEPLRNEDEVFGCGSGSRVAVDRLRRMTTPKILEVFKNSVMRASFEDPSSGGVYKW